jgi:hypothetical protein
MLEIALGGEGVESLVRTHFVGGLWQTLVTIPLNDYRTVKLE